MVDQGDLLVGAVVSVAIANDYIKAVCGITDRQHVSSQPDRMELRAHLTETACLQARNNWWLRDI